MPLAHDLVLIARIGEISLKGLNRGDFEGRLAANLQRRLKGLGEVRVVRSQSVVRVEPADPAAFDFEEAIRRATCIFGIVAVNLARSFPVGFPEILAQAEDHVRGILVDGRPRTFKVEARRSDKSFPLDSPAICREVGAHLLEAFPGLLTVDVHRPSFVLHVEVRDTVLLYDRVERGHRGLPVGTAGKAMLLLSGGIDSPVAGYMMASRGLEIEAVHFQSIPFTSERALRKVEALAGLLARYAGRVALHVVPFAEIQTMLRDGVPEDMMTICMRRAMMRIAERIAVRRGCRALITGESLGQVASQTMPALATTGAVVSLPVFRPLIGLDKDATIEIARRIGTFETSIQPYEDCCTVFVAKHPKTKPDASATQRLEDRLPLEDAIRRAIDAAEVKTAGWDA